MSKAEISRSKTNNKCGEMQRTAAKEPRLGSRVGVDGVCFDARRGIFFDSSSWRLVIRRLLANAGGQRLETSGGCARCQDESTKQRKALAVPCSLPPLARVGALEENSTSRACLVADRASYAISQGSDSSRTHLANLRGGLRIVAKEKRAGKSPNGKINTTIEFGHKALRMRSTFRNGTAEPPRSLIVNLNIFDGASLDLILLLLFFLLPLVLLVQLIVQAR